MFVWCVWVPIGSKVQLLDFEPTQVIRLVFINLHWLPALHSLAPFYASELLCHLTSARSLRTTNQRLVVVDWAIAVMAPTTFTILFLSFFIFVNCSFCNLISINVLLFLYRYFLFFNACIAQRLFTLLLKQVYFFYHYYYDVDPLEDFWKLMVPLWEKAAFLQDFRSCARCHVQKSTALILERLTFNPFSTIFHPGLVCLSKCISNTPAFVQKKFVLMWHSPAVSTSHVLPAFSDVSPLEQLASLSVILWYTGLRVWTNSRATWRLDDEGRACSGL